MTRWAWNGVTKIVMGFWPEHLRETASAYSVPLKLDVAMVEPLGSDALVHVKFAGQRVIGRVAPKGIGSTDKEIGLHLDLDYLHLFDQHTGLCLPSA